MGCDIHLYLEKTTPNGWEHVPPPSDWNVDNLDRSGPAPYFAGRWFTDRNYELFAWLADVRNYHDQKPLAPERGVPKDASPEVKKEKREWGPDGHSHSWFALSELQVSGATKHAGCVDEKDYVAWRASGEPNPCGWYRSGSKPTVSEAEYKAGVRPEVSGPIAWAGFAIRCEWETPMGDEFSRFLKFVRAAQEYAGHDARIVFWFDN